MSSFLYGEEMPLTSDFIPVPIEPIFGQRGHMKDKSECSDFLSIMGIVYAILMAAGLQNGWQTAEKAMVPFSELTWSLLLKHKADILTGALYALSCAFILIRFFFVPSKNLPPLIAKLKNKSWVLIVDIPLMLFHSALFYLICAQFEQIVTKKMYLSFAIFFSLLMFINIAWLMRIRYYRKNSENDCYSKWIGNNGIHLLVLIAVISYFIIGWFTPTQTWQVLIILAITLSNSIWDFCLTSEDYFNSKVVV